MTNHQLLDAAVDEVRLAQASLRGAQMATDRQTVCVCLDAFNSHMQDARSFVSRVVHEILSPAVSEAAGSPGPSSRSGSEAGTAGEPSKETAP